MTSITTKEIAHIMSALNEIRADNACKGKKQGQLVKTAIEFTGRGREQKRAIENYKCLILTYTNLKKELKENRDLKPGSTLVKHIIEELIQARKEYTMLDEYLDILRQLPEKPAP